MAQEQCVWRGLHQEHKCILKADCEVLQEVSSKMSWFLEMHLKGQQARGGFMPKQSLVVGKAFAGQGRAIPRPLILCFDWRTMTAFAVAGHCLVAAHIICLTIDTVRSSTVPCIILTNHPWVQCHMVVCNIIQLSKQHRLLFLHLLVPLPCCV